LRGKGRRAEGSKHHSPRHASALRTFLTQLLGRCPRLVCDRAVGAQCQFAQSHAALNHAPAPGIRKKTLAIFPCPPIFSSPCLSQSHVVRRRRPWPRGSKLRERVKSFALKPVNGICCKARARRPSVSLQNPPSWTKPTWPGLKRTCRSRNHASSSVRPPDPLIGSHQRARSGRRNQPINSTLKERK